MTRNVHGVEVSGVSVDNETRCRHYDSQRDIIAIKFRCCSAWFPCHLCHAEIARHKIVRWPKAEFLSHAILCGGCGHQATIASYLASPLCCQSCGRAFNPGCATHHHIYFESGEPVVQH